ncbi:hypothetical protein ANCDUO_02656 [Ancylostoma duodenale]|uniref:Uncharacterized protein n=1 Tax=Ancylostoma duodenale TaxID=51022 RepID=A0A0C2HBY6_9BILA|nr:hypothetical protein ANCDUO_02656 [Ancylostoma duodenale]
MPPAGYYAGYGQQQGVPTQGNYPGYVMPGYQGFPQQPYTSQPSYQQYPPSSVMPATNQWQDAVPPAQQVSLLKQPAEALPVAPNAVPTMQGGGAQQTQMPQYPPTQHPYHLQNPVNGAEIPAVQQPEPTEQPLISFD